MKSREQSPLLTLVIASSFGVTIQGCVHNVRDEIATTIVIEDMQLDGQIIKDDGWVEVKRLKARTDHTTSIGGITFARTDLAIKDLIPELAYPSVLQWTVFRGALVIDGFLEEGADFMDNKFYFHRKVILYAGVSKIISLSMRLLPSGRPTLIGFMLSGYELPDNTQVVYNEPNIGNEIVVIHPVYVEDDQY